MKETCSVLPVFIALLGGSPNKRINELNLADQGILIREMMVDHGE